MKKVALLVVLTLLVACSSTQKKEEPKPIEPEKPVEQKTVINDLENSDGILGIWQDADGKFFSIETTNELKERAESVIVNDLYENKFFKVDVDLLNSKLSTALDMTKTIIYYHNHVIVLLSTTDKEENVITKMTNGSETIIDIQAASKQDYLFEDHSRLLTGVVQINDEHVQFLTYSENSPSEIANNKYTISLFDYSISDNSINLLDTQVVHSSGKGGTGFTLFSSRVQELLATSTSTYFQNNSVTIEGRGFSVIDQATKLFAQQDWISTLLSKANVYNISNTLYSIERLDSKFTFTQYDSSGQPSVQLMYTIEGQDTFGDANLLELNGKMYALIPGAKTISSDGAINHDNYSIHIIELDFANSSISESNVPSFDGFFINISKFY